VWITKQGKRSVHHENHVLLICVCGFKANPKQITKYFTPYKKTKKTKKTSDLGPTVRINPHNYCLYESSYYFSFTILSLLPHFLYSQHHSCYHCQAVNQLPLGVSPPAQEHLSMQKISFRNLNTHTQRKVESMGILSFWDAYGMQSNGWG